eukprot:NODE_6183_length_915_cov_40.125000_g5592_i0.p1 GENE.NODE_6183_length_915_cov_40.125000_g5592_i0~~NODE_6183_length_915_cov_40.125000_g5592_i0.p1  ORF type:complete len:263 (+),score=48.30 NODE_6183_length_915_cov_40.125000_g5592_i0:54-842(+)
MLMRRALGLSRRAFSTSLIRLAPDAKLVKIYQDGDFESAQYPVELVGGTHTSFAKLLYTFADSIEGKKYELYVNEFEKLEGIKKKLGPFWGEADILKDEAFSSLNPGFRFVLAWMASEGKIDALTYVKASYLELVDEITGQVRANITVGPKSKDKVETIKSEASQVLSKSGGAQKKIVFTVTEDASVDGYYFEVGTIYVDKTASATKSSEGTGKKEVAYDWTALPQLPGLKKSSTPDFLLKILGGKVDELQEADAVERKFYA